ncbi:MAG TPA: PAS domain-containing protein, partial [Flavisolibacter sp.]|nr:PAS domain-containing protein [Flavisolibacter sp.]
MRVKLDHEEDILKTDEPTDRSVTILLLDQFFILTGQWSWKLNTEKVFTSDVILNTPIQFEGTKSIIFPEDVTELFNKLGSDKIIDQLSFRIITTFGEVKKLEGSHLKVDKNSLKLEDLKKDLVEQYALNVQLLKEKDNLQLISELYSKSQRYSGIGIWYFNQSINETWYSDQVFRIFELPPQSLNAHLNTFNHYIFPDDKDIVVEYINKALKSQCPLHLEFSIQTSKGKKVVLYLSHWTQSQNGHSILFGTYQEITGLKASEKELKDAMGLAGIYRQQITFDEINASLGHWQINLLTRKVIISDNLYRLFGIKSPAIAPGLNSFINFIHHDDQEMVIQANKKLLTEQVVPNIDFRITRSDGKIRYLSQKAKLLNYGNEPIIAGTVQDVTVPKMLEKKLADSTFKIEVLSKAQNLVEEVADLATCIFDPESGIYIWSEQFYTMLGIKTHSIELKKEVLISNIHPEDQKIFLHEWDAAIQLKKQRSLDFRLIKKGVIHYMMADFSFEYIHEKSLLVAVLQDVSHYESLRSRFQKQIQMVDVLSENIVDRIIVTDLNNNILLWNKQCELTYRIPKDEAIGKNFFDVFPMLKTEEEVALFEKVLMGESLSFPASKSIMGNEYFNLNMLP